MSPWIADETCIRRHRFRKAMAHIALGCLLPNNVFVQGFHNFLRGKVLGHWLIDLLNAIVIPNERVGSSRSPAIHWLIEPFVYWAIGFNALVMRFSFLVMLSIANLVMLSVAKHRVVVHH